MSDIKQTGNDMVRVNARIGKTLNEWLDSESSRTGVPKSTLIHLALEQYISQKQALASMQDMTSLLEGMHSGFRTLEQKIEKLSSGIETKQ